MRPTFTIWDTIGCAASLSAVQAVYAARFGELTPADYAILSDEARAAVIAGGFMPLELMTPDEATAAGCTLAEYAEAHGVAARVSGRAGRRHDDDVR